MLCITITSHYPDNEQQAKWSPVISYYEASVSKVCSIRPLKGYFVYEQAISWLTLEYIS